MVSNCLLNLHNPAYVKEKLYVSKVVARKDQAAAEEMRDMGLHPDGMLLAEAGKVQHAHSQIKEIARGEAFGRDAQPGALIGRQGLTTIP